MEAFALSFSQWRSYTFEYTESWAALKGSALKNDFQ